MIGYAIRLDKYNQKGWGKKNSVMVDAWVGAGNGTPLTNDLRSAHVFNTKENAERVAFGIVSRHPVLLGTITVREVRRTKVGFTSRAVN